MLIFLNASLRAAACMVVAASLRAAACCMVAAALRAAMMLPLWVSVAVRPFPLVVCVALLLARERGLSLVSFCGCRPFALYPCGLASLRSLPARGLSLVTFEAANAATCYRFCNK